MLNNIVSNVAVAALVLGVSASPVASPDASSSGQIPFKFPLSNGFPNIKVPSPELTLIQKNAHGTLPNGALPTKISAATATTFQVIAANEIFEVAYFSSLLKNITSGHYDVGKGATKSIVYNALHAVRAQEELHALGANAILANTGNTPYEPCEYIFPVSDFDSAIALAATFTDIVLGTLQGAELTFAVNNDTAVIPLVGGVIGQEGEQTGFYRNLGGKIPSALPFLTRSSGVFAFSALNQMFVVPGSCPTKIDVPVLPPLTVMTKDISPKTTSVDFAFAKPAGFDCKMYSLVYLNQQNTPVVMPLMNVKYGDGMVYFTAEFPYEANLMNGLTLAAITNSAGPFTDADAVAAKAVFGPGIIEIN